MTASRVGTLVCHLAALSGVWAREGLAYVDARAQRVDDAFQCPFDLTHQAKMYLEARAQLIRPVKCISGDNYWQDIWLIPDSVWSQLQEEYQIINNGRQWTPCEFRTYVSMTFGKPQPQGDNPGWRCRSRYYTFLHPTEPEPEYSSDSEEEDSQAESVNGSRTRANDTDSPRVVSAPQSDGGADESSGASAAGGRWAQATTPGGSPINVYCPPPFPDVASFTEQQAQATQAAMSHGPPGDERLPEDKPPQPSGSDPDP